MKTVFITGGSGLMGVTLAETLLEKGLKVVATDSKPNKLVNSPNYSFIQANIEDKGQITNALSDAKPDVMVHLACSVDNDFPSILTSAEEKTCAAVDKYLYKAAIDAGVGDIILLSTYQVYAYQKTREPIRETADEKPSTIYAKMKFDSEKTLSKLVSKSASCKGVIARVCPIYTKDYPDNLRAKIYDPKDGCSFIYGYGDYGYSFCCLYNFVDFVCGVINVQSGINYQGVYNVCDTKPIAAKEIVEFLRNYHKLGAVIQRNYGADNVKAVVGFGAKGAKNDYRYNDLTIACSNISYDNTKAQRISTFRWKLANTK